MGGDSNKYTIYSFLHFVSSRAFLFICFLGLLTFVVGGEFSVRSSGACPVGSIFSKVLGLTVVSFATSAPESIFIGIIIGG